MVWTINVLQSSEHAFLQLCQCETVEAMAAVLDAITGEGVTLPYEIRVDGVQAK